MRLRVVWTTKPEELTPFLPVWDRLAAAAPQKLPMLAGSWVYAQFSTLLEKRATWECAMVLSGEELVGVLPLIRRPRRFGITTLGTPFQLHTRSGDALVKRGHEAPVFSALWNVLGDRQHSFFRCRWQGVAADSPTALFLPLQKPELLLVRQSAGFGSFLRVRGTLEDYWRILGKNFRGSLKSARKKLSRLDQPEFVCISGQTAGEPQHLAAFLQLEASGWKGAQKTAILLDSRLQYFYTELVERFSENGWIEWYFLRGSGKMLAAAMGVRLGRRLSLIKIAYDEAYAHCAPGNLLMLDIVERSFRDGCTEWIDCLSDMPWHRRWRMEQREYFDFFLYPRRFFPCLAGYLPHRCYLQLKKIPVLRTLWRGLKGRISSFRLRPNNGKRLPRGQE